MLRVEFRPAQRRGSRPARGGQLPKSGPLGQIGEVMTWDHSGSP
ncbi:hypothetical protein [Streptomyces goshikiensis]